MVVKSVYPWGDLATTSYDMLKVILMFAKNVNRPVSHFNSIHLYSVDVVSKQLYRNTETVLSITLIPALLQAFGCY